MQTLINQPIISKNHFVLVPTDASEISYLWKLLDEWPSSGVWKSMYKDYAEFVEDISSRFLNPKDMLWTCWTKNGKASRKIGMILLSDITYGLSVEVHGVADKEYLKTSKSRIIDKCFREVLDFSFKELGVARVNATFYKKDSQLCAFLKRNGFKRNAVLKKSVYVNQDIHDTYIYGLIEDDFLTEVNKNV